MNAQDKWKELYRRAKYARENYSLFESFDILATASMYRREAALERKLAAAQREIEAQAARIAEFQSYVKLFNDAVTEDESKDKDTIATLAGLVRLKYGNLYPDVNEILKNAGYGWPE